jgi:REP element-mobilizing transposase RayT
MVSRRIYQFRWFKFAIAFWCIFLSCHIKKFSKLASRSEVWVHAVWGTKRRQPMILPAIENRVFNVISNQFHELGCQLRIINGMPDHVHCLFRMQRTQTIADVIKQVKGSSSFQINSWGILPTPFVWQIGYGAFSVNYRDLEGLYRYIKNQKIHHRLHRWEKQ